MLLTADRKRTAETMSLLVDAMVAGAAYGALKEPGNAIRAFKKAMEL